MFTITPAAPANFPAAAAVLAEAFEHDTVMASLVAGTDQPRTRLTLLFEALLRSAAPRGIRIDLARRDNDGAIIGAAIWELPGYRASTLARVGELPALMRALGWRGLWAAARLQSRLASYRPAEPHWYLAEIGVGSAARGAGVGSALLANRLGAIDAAGEAAYLESSNERNRALYQRMGFTPIGIIRDIRGAAPAAMWRPGVSRG